MKASTVGFYEKLPEKMRVHRFPEVQHLLTCDQNGGLLFFRADEQVALSLNEPVNAPSTVNRVINHLDFCVTILLVTTTGLSINAQASYDSEGGFSDNVADRHCAS